MKLNPLKAFSSAFKQMDRSLRSVKESYVAKNPYPGEDVFVTKTRKKDNTTHKKWRRYKKGSFGMRHPWST